MNSPQRFGTALLKGTFCLILLFGQEYCYAQSRSSKIQLGVFFMSGNSLGINPSSSPINNQVNDYRNGFVQFGLYTFIKFKPDSASSVFKYLRVDLGLANRTGTFDVGNGNLARLNSPSADLVIMVPIRFKVLDGIDAYAGFGSVMSYRFRRIITPAQSLPNVSTGEAFKLGFATELGFKLGKSLLLRSRCLKSYLKPQAKEVYN